MSHNTDNHNFMIEYKKSLGLYVNDQTIPEPMRVLQECIEVMKKKADDYQNGNSTVKQADYYPHGIQSLYDMVNTKRLRVKSLMDKQLAGGEANFEGLEDSLKDLINYAAFSVAWLRGKIEGQDANLDAFNRPKPTKTPVYTANSHGVGMMLLNEIHAPGNTQIKWNHPDHDHEDRD